MPVFFYVDPDFHDDPQMFGVDEILLSYTFFKAKSFGAPDATGHQTPHKPPAWAMQPKAEDTLPTLGKTAVSKAKHMDLKRADTEIEGELYNSSNRSKGIF